MGWQWHQQDHMQIICTLLQTDNHASISPLGFLQARCPSCRPTNSVKALKASILHRQGNKLKLMCFDKKELRTGNKTKPSTTSVQS